MLAGAMHVFAQRVILHLARVISSAQTESVGNEGEENPFLFALVFTRDFFY
jgi:hypothetical protein